MSTFKAVIEAKVKGFAGSFAAFGVHKQLATASLLSVLALCCELEQKGD